MNLLEMSFTAGLLILILIVLRALFLNILPKLTFPILWGIVLIRLIFPFSFNTEYSLTAFLLQPFIGELQPAEGEFSVSETMPIYLENTIANTQLANDSQVALLNLETDVDVQSVVIANGFETILELIRMNWMINIWFVGAMVSAAFFILGYWKSYQKIRCALPVDNEFLDSWKSEQRMKRTVLFLVSDQVTTPLTVGVLKPKIILPDGMDLQDKSILGYVLAHEFYHIKRLDALWKALAVGIVCLHWFNPLVWIAFVLANRDLEISCDAWVVKKFGIHTKKMYAYVLISMAEYQSKFTPLYSSFARHAAEERIESIMKTKKTTVIGAVGAFVIIGLLAFNAFAAPTDEYDYNDDENLTEYEEIYPEFDYEEDTDASEESTAIVVDDQPNEEYIAADEEISNIDADDFEEFPEEETLEFPDSIANVAGLRDVTAGNMTVRAGDLFSRYNDFPESNPDTLSEDHLSFDEVVTLSIEAIYNQYGFNTDGLIFDVFPIAPLVMGDDLIVDMDSNPENRVWFGMILASDYDPSVRMPVTGYVPTNEQILFSIQICARTGEILFLINNLTGDQIFG